MNSVIGEIEKLKTLLIRAEDKNRWEYRAPLVPEDLREIINLGQLTRDYEYLNRYLNPIQVN